MSISLHSGTNLARRRDFSSNKLDGTIPAALSALKLLTALCARRACNAAPFACVRAPRPDGARKRPCAHLHAPSHCRDLSSMLTSTVEGVCALRHGWSTFRRPGTERARVQHPLEYPCAVPYRTKTHAATALLCWCECAALTDA